MCVKLHVYCSLLLTFNCVFVQSKKPTFNIGGIFDLSKIDQKTVFLSAIDEINREHPNCPFTLKAHVVKHDNKNVLSLSKKTCNLLAKGVRVIIGPNSSVMSRHIGSICSRKDITQIETRPYSEHEEHNYFKVNLYPHTPVVGEMFVAILKWLDWCQFTIIYENNESLTKIHQLLSYKSSKYDVKLKQLVLDDKNSYRLMLNAIKNSGETHFVVVCGLEMLKQFLQQAQQVGLLSEKHHYVIYNFDMNNIDVEQYQYGGCQIFSVRFVNPANHKVQNVISELEENPDPFNFTYRKLNTLNLETALIMDAVKLIHENLREYSNNNYINHQQLLCNDSDSWWHGTSFQNNLNMLTIEGYSGLIKFDTQGYWSQFTAEIIELTTEGLVRKGTWNSSNGLVPDAIPEEKRPDEGSLSGGHFNILTVLTHPYGLLKDTTTNQSGNDRYEGYGIDLIQKLAEKLQFTYTIYIQDDRANGNYNNATGKWDGMIGRILDEETKPKMHFAIGDLTVTSEREKAVDFTHPFMTLGISILYKKPEPAPPSLFMFASPFSPQVWLLLCIAYVFVSISLFIIGRFSPSEWQNPYPCIEEPEFLINQFTFRNSFWFTVGSLMQQGTELAPIAISTRMLAGVWWFFTLIMVSSYTANLAAFLTVTTLQTPFKDIKELAKQTEIKYGAKSHGATESFFRDSDKEEYQTVWSFMKNNPDVMVSDNDRGVENVLNQNYAFLMESTSIEYVTERKCSLAQVGDRLDEKGYAIAMKKNSTYRPAFNTALLKLQETGWLSELKIRWWKEKLGGGNCQPRSSTTNVTALNLQNVGGVFLVLVVGTLLGILVAFLELSLDICVYIKEQNTKYRKAMKEEMKFFLKFKKNVKPVRMFDKVTEPEEAADFTFNNINYLENYINENNQNG